MDSIDRLLIGGGLLLVSLASVSLSVYTARLRKAIYLLQQEVDIIENKLQLLHGAFYRERSTKHTDEIDAIDTKDW